MSYCSACGTRQEPGASVCPACGNSLADSQRQVDPAAVPEPAPRSSPPYTPPGYAPPPEKSQQPSVNFGTPYPGGSPISRYGAYNATPTSTAAIVSLVSGLSAWVVLPFIGALAAVIAGHMARKEIRESEDGMKGNGMAIAGLILGYSQFALGCLAVVILMAILGVASS
jgi:hypothetical protein